MSNLQEKDLQYFSKNLGKNLNRLGVFLIIQIIASFIIIFILIGSVLTRILTDNDMNALIEAITSMFDSVYVIGIILSSIHMILISTIIYTLYDGQKTLKRGKEYLLQAIYGLIGLVLFTIISFIVGYYMLKTLKEDLTTIFYDEEAILALVEEYNLKGVISSLPTFATILFSLYSFNRLNKWMIVNKKFISTKSDRYSLTKAFKQINTGYLCALAGVFLGLIPIDFIGSLGGLLDLISTVFLVMGFLKIGKTMPYIYWSEPGQPPIAREKQTRYEPQNQILPAANFKQDPSVGISKEDSSSKICPACGDRESPQNSRFCMNCGYAFTSD